MARFLVASLVVAARLVDTAAAAVLSFWLLFACFSDVCGFITMTDDYGGLCRKKKLSEISLSYKPWIFFFPQMERKRRNLYMRDYMRRKRQREKEQVGGKCFLLLLSCLGEVFFILNWKLVSPFSPPENNTFWS